MRRRLWISLAAVLVVLVGAVTAVASGGDGENTGAYRVRAIFDSGAFIISGSDVKIAGVVVGKVDEVELTPQNKAAVTFTVDDPAYTSFRKDATCRIGLQSLIGEQFIECVPTKPRADGVALPPPLTKIGRGDGKGSYLLPVKQTSSPVGPDLLNNIMRAPEQDRFRLIISELGTGLAGNGAELRAAINRANPTLQQANKFVEILANQNQIIDRLTVQSDQILAPLAEKRQDLSGFIRTAGQTAQAAADRGDALEANFQKFPAFLRELKPATERISALADQVGPSVANLSAQAPSLNRAVTGLGPFAKAATPAFVTLGDTADQGRKTFPRIRTLVDRFGDLARPLEPLAKDLSDLGTSFDQTGGIGNIAQLLYYYTGTLNGKDGTAHYLRTEAYVSSCVDRSPNPTSGCNGKLRVDTTRVDNSGSARSSSTPVAGAEGSATSAAAARLASLLGPETKDKP